jgi:hypothetical protein
MLQRMKRSIMVGLLALAVAFGVASSGTQNLATTAVEQVADPGGHGGGTGG